MRPSHIWIAVVALAGCAKGGKDFVDLGIDASSGDDDTVDAPRRPPADADQHVDSQTDACAFSGALATWDLTGQAGSQASTTVTSTGGGVTASALTRAAALTATSGLNSINSSNWPTGAALDATKYYSFTVTPPAGCNLSITSLAIVAKSSGTGPVTAVAATSVDNFAGTTAVSTTAPSSPAVTAANQTAVVEVRLYGYGAGGTAGTMRVENTLTVNGTVQQ
jgi:hypothetical protein